MDNAAEAAITTGVAEMGRVTFMVSNCEYVGAMREPDRALVEGTVTCPVAQADGSTMSLTGSWTAVR